MTLIGTMGQPRSPGVPLHDKHFQALLTSTRVKWSKVVDSGFLYFVDHDFADDDAADDGDVATAEDDDDERIFLRSKKMLMQWVATAMKD